MRDSKASGPIAGLRALAGLINSSLDKIEAALVSRSQTFPSPDEPFDPVSEAVRMAPDVHEHVSIIVGAASQLAAAVRVPALALSYGTMAFYISACIRVALQAHVAEILRDAGPKGLHVSEIAKPTGADPYKLARCLRLLATNHFFREVEPDVFALNKVSSILDTDKPVADILADPQSKHDGTFGFAAIVEHITDEGMKGAAWLPETLLSPETAKSGDVNKTALSKAYNTDLPMWTLFEQPQYSYNLRRFGVAMQGLQNANPPGTILEGYDWKALPEGSVVVDVGGGVGSLTLALYIAFKHLNFVVQDREPVVQAGAQFWAKRAPKAVESGRVKLMPHDFLATQPIKNPAVFVLRSILRDWSDQYVLVILKQLREAAGPGTQLLVVDNTMSYACPDSTAAHQIPGALTKEAPAPLLANKGIANAQLYGADLHMMTMFNGSERTVAEFNAVLKQAGWKLERVIHSAGFEIENAKLVAVPI